MVVEVIMPVQNCSSFSGVFQHCLPLSALPCVTEKHSTTSSGLGRLCVYKTLLAKKPKSTSVTGRNTHRSQRQLETLEGHYPVPLSARTFSVPCKT